MRNKLIFLIILIIFLITRSSFASFSNVQITQNQVISAYDNQIYIIAYTVKNTGNTPVRNVVVICQIVDGYDKVLKTITRTYSLNPGQEQKGEFQYFRPDTSFLIYHKIFIKK
ncbi:MAG TPA: hypothetical protein PL110_07370 [Candidatus Eremiobacteraeota bacterium]|nr:MAG: hypothetical protein BWY64_03522 [bacterium ADurb.Bin363]HPZ07915.1 hypothetical protein [Candidatus Eremiobacteraeota bacterium]